MYPNVWWGILHRHQKAVSRQDGRPLFTLEATKRNRIFCQNFDEILCTRNGERLSTRERCLLAKVLML